MAVRCTTCDKDNPADALFCQGCGRRLELSLSGLRRSQQPRCELLQEMRDAADCESLAYHPLRRKGATSFTVGSSRARWR